MANFRVIVTKSPRNGNLTVRYRNGKTKLASGAWKFFTIETIKKEQREFINGEWRTASWIANDLAEKTYSRYLNGELLGNVDSSESLEEVIENYLDDKKDIEWTTLRHYRLSLMLLKNYFNSLEELSSKKKIAEWGKHLMTVKIKGDKIGYSNNSRHGILNDTRMFCNWLVYEKKMAKSPFEKEHSQEKPLVPAQTKARPRHYSLEEFFRLEKEVAIKDRIVHVACRLGHDCGLRKVEICGDDVKRFEGVRLEDLIYQRDGKVDLHVRAEVSKGKKKERWVRVPETTLALIFDVVGKRRTGPICPMKASHFNWVVEVAIERAGIKKMPGLFIHSFRHSLGTNFTEYGGTLEALQHNLGHEDLQTTQIYSRPRQKYLGTGIDRAAEQIEMERKRFNAEQNAEQNNEVFGKNGVGSGPNDPTLAPNGYEHKNQNEI